MDLLPARIGHLMSILVKKAGSSDMAGGSEDSILSLSTAAVFRRFIYSGMNVTDVSAQQLV